MHIDTAPSQPIAIPVQLTLPDGAQVTAVAEGPEVVAHRREDVDD